MPRRSPRRREDVDTQLYNSELGDKFAGYNASIAVNEDNEDLDEVANGLLGSADD